MKTDIQIAQEATLKPIWEVAQKLDIGRRQGAQPVRPRVGEQKPIQDQAAQRQTDDQKRVRKTDLQHGECLTPGDQFQTGFQLRLLRQIKGGGHQKIRPVGKGRSQRQTKHALFEPRSCGMIPKAYPTT